MNAYSIVLFFHVSGSVLSATLHFRLRLMSGWTFGFKDNGYCWRESNQIGQQTGCALNGNPYGFRERPHQQDHIW